MIKKAISIAAIFIVIFVIAISIARANPVNPKPFGADPQFFGPEQPVAGPAALFLKEPASAPFMAEQEPAPTFERPGGTSEPAALPKDGPGFLMESPRQPGNDFALFPPVGSFSPNVRPA